MQLRRYLLLAWLLAIGHSATAAVLPVSVTKSFHNENWFPLSKKDMEAAAIDTALDQISAKGVLSFVPGGTRKGTLDLKVTLVEPAELVKITIELNAEGLPSAVGTASTSIKGLDHDGIYYAFEHVGREAAERLDAKLAALLAAMPRKDGPPPAQAPMERPAEPPRRAPTVQTMPEASPLPPRNCDDSVLKGLMPTDHARWSAKAIYNRGQQLKERFCYFDARVAFEAVSTDERPGDASWRQLAQNELVYGLPLFEARQLSLLISRLIKDESKGWTDISAHMQRIELLYRQILIENETNVERVMAVQAELDNFHLSWEALKNSLQFNADNEIDFLKRALHRYMASPDARLPVNEEEARVRLAPTLGAYLIVSYQVVRRTGQASLRVRHKRWGTEWEILFDEDFNVQSKRLH